MYVRECTRESVRARERVHAGVYISTSLFFTTNAEN
jgi:hypothetical protein